MPNPFGAGGMMQTNFAKSEYGELFAEKVDLELKYIAELQQILPPSQSLKLQEAVEKRSLMGLGLTTPTLLSNVDMDAVNEDDKENAAAVSLVPSGRVFHLTFKGDVQASQVEQLRREVSAVIQVANATRGDRVVMDLDSGGGTVTGYGLAGAQLERLKMAGLHLTVCINQVGKGPGDLGTSSFPRTHTPFPLSPRHS